MTGGRMSLKSRLFGGMLGIAILVMLAVFSLSANAASPVVASKYAAIVIDRETQEVFFARNADVHRYPASLTKMMTLYMVFEALEKRQIRIDGHFKVSRRAAGQPPSKIGLRAGSKIKVKDAVLALVTKSANDVATTVAENLGKTEWQFARMMTAKAKQIGMKRTRFRNASGLPHRGQVSTARDMAILAKRLIEDYPGYFELFNTQRFRYKGRTYKNHNRLLAKYKGTNGIKTGYINAAGFNLVSSVERDGRNLIGVVFGGRTGRLRDKHMVSILDKSFRRAGPAKDMLVAIVPKPRPNALQLASVETTPEVGSVDPEKEIVNAGATKGPDAIGALIQAAVVPPVLNAQKDVTTASLVPRPRPIDPVRAKTPAKTVVASASAGATPSAKQPAPSLVLPKGNWGIQVGAFSFEHPANRAVAQARKLMPVLLGGALDSVEKVDGKKRVFRARLRNLTESAALEACVRLKARRMGCVPVPPVDGVQIAQKD